MLTKLRPAGVSAGVLFGIASLIAVGAAAQSPTDLRQTHFHLAPRIADPGPITGSAILDRLESLCRLSAKWQEANGALIDPFLHREYQYATPYFAFAVGTLAHAGRAGDLLPHGIAAMEHATSQFEAGRAGVPDQHGEFFLASLSESLPIYRGLVPEATWQSWYERLRLPLSQIIGEKNVNNWRTYAMKGEWQRAKLGMISRETAVGFIEESWRNGQAARFASGPVPLYHDRSSDPDTLSVALVGEGNLMSLVLEGYDGPSAADIKAKVLAAAKATVLLVDPTGQVPANGRTDDHVWPEVGLQLLFATAAPMVRAEGNARTADAMDRLGELSFAGMDRWRRTDIEGVGSYFITKNHFDPKLRVGYQNASQYSNYTGAMMFHLAELYRARSEKARGTMEASIVDVGGYAVELDSSFATAFANAGGLEMQFNLRGETTETNDNWWTPVGVVRIARAGWDTRLGPSDGAQTASAAVSFAPEMLTNGIWTRLSELTAHYGAKWSVQIVNPALVRCTLVYRSLGSGSEAEFRDEFTITPDGVLSTVSRRGQGAWGVTWPLLGNDGEPLVTSVSGRIAETRFRNGTDLESFLAVDEDAYLQQGAAIRSSFGDLVPIRLTTSGVESHTFVYPHNAIQPQAAAVLASFRITDRGFNSVLGRVVDDVYVSPDFAGGQAASVDLNGDGRVDVRFDRVCGFVMQIKEGRVTAIEADRKVTARFGGHHYNLLAYQPVTL